mmetsp:Transcript_32482/g.68311  ORF Transcript_32482/g.68311 Transcript_32482/m.68311 type:complete len:289 (-) Transcript_32482:195-1061(-)
MCTMTVRNTNVDEGPSRCPIKDPASKDLDDSCGTAKTIDRSDVEDEMPITRPPIVICEDDAHHNYAKETYFHTSLIKDSVQVQKYHKVNDDERHEENPHLEDFLIPHHSVHIERPEEAEATGEISTTKNECCTQEILHTKASAPEETQEKRKVHFGTVEVRDYDMILGDHPCCRYGPPLTLDWDYLEYEPLDVNEYEFRHPPRRNVREMGINYYFRERLLSNAGFTKLDFKLSKKEVNRVKLNRKLTQQIVAHYPLLKVEAAVESVCRKCKRLVKEDHWKADKRRLAV